jgi:hypothetical protein
VCVDRSICAVALQFSNAVKLAILFLRGKIATIPPKRIFVGRESARGFFRLEIGTVGAFGSWTASNDKKTTRKMQTDLNLASLLGIWGSAFLHKLPLRD